MDKPFALIALWLAFAAAAVGVGFGAAGLIDGPFTGASSAIEDANGSAAPGLGGTPTDSVAPPSTSSPGTRSSSPTSSSRATSAPHTTSKPSASTKVETPTPQRGETTTVERSRVTSGGSVFARCSDGLVSVSASPAVGWDLDDIDTGRNTRAGVQFEHSEKDSEVTVEVRCAGASPAFQVRERSDESDDDSGDDS